ncbi:adiponectin receptor protein 1-like isoform X2 [Lytechinus pictus]|uniref:adiponectin receptor protein 1-like isoform X2 n=1 Tax=Lytechinus pictus TaxID=7653 RepID=UPI0030BA2171
MNKSPDLEERRGDEEDTTPDPQTFLLSQPEQASPSSTSGKVRRRIKKKRQPRSSQTQGSDSDSMDEDPEVGSNQPLRDDQEPRDPSTITVEEVTEVEETSTLRSSDGEKEVKEPEVEPQPAGGSDSEYDFALLKQQADELAHKFVQKVKDVTWKVTHHNFLPDWLKDNDYLHYHHRPPLPSFRTCFKSIFRIHTETGNIWTHLLGCIAFIIIAIYFLVQSIMSRDDWQEIVAYMMFFLGAILCLGFSCLFHTCYCHSCEASKIFSKLDYSGITFLIVGSFVPWLYFGFYCENITRYVYLALILVLGALCLFVALRDTFSLPKYRPLRAGRFLIHYCVVFPVRTSPITSSQRYLQSTKVPSPQGRSIRCFRPQRCDTSHSLREHQQLPDGHPGGWTRLDDTHGMPLHLRSITLCYSHPRTFFPWKV